MTEQTQRCPIDKGHKVKRPDYYFKRKVAEVCGHQWASETYCYVVVRFHNGDYAVLRWNMLDGNPQSDWDPTEEVIEVQSEHGWINKGIKRSMSAPKIAECGPQRLVLDITSVKRTWRIVLHKALGGSEADEMAQTGSCLAHA